MTFVKGHPKVGGKVKGQPNKATVEIKEAFKNLIEQNTPNMIEWLDRVATTDPGKALTLCAQLGEFVIPKLARVESTGEMKHKFEPLTIKRSDG